MSTTGGVTAIGTVEIRVTPEIMETQAGEVKKYTDEVKGYFDDMESLITGTSGYWIGEAGELLRAQYLDRKEDIETMFKRLYEHHDDLMLIAGNYRSAESATVAMATGLQADIIT